MILCLGEFLLVSQFHTAASYQGGFQIILALLLKSFHIVIF